MRPATVAVNASNRLHPRVRRAGAALRSPEGDTRTLDDYLAGNPTTGLLIARGDTILVERYQYARNDRHRFTSFPMAKTVTAMLVGIAIAEGRIRSVDDLAAAYVPALADTEYGRTSLRHCWRCPPASASSRGIRARTTSRGSSPKRSSRSARVGPAAVKPYNERLRRSGASVRLRLCRDPGAGPRPSRRDRATGGRLPPREDLGADRRGGGCDLAYRRCGAGATYCCLNAVLRDYARLGLLLAHDGRRRRPADHPGGLAARRHDSARGQLAPQAVRGDPLLRLRLPDLDLPRRPPHVRPTGAHGQAIASIRRAGS